MKALTLLAVVLIVLAAACGGPSTSETSLRVTPTTQPAATTRESDSAQPPHVLTSLPEGKLLVLGPSTGTRNYKATFVIQANRAFQLAPTDVTASADGNYASYLERADDVSAPPTALIVRRTDGTDVFRLPLASGTSSAGWAPGDNRLAYQIGQTVYVRDVDTGDQLQFEAPGAARVQSWLARGSELLLVTRAPENGTESRIYVMNARSGATSEIVLPVGAIIGPGAQHVTFSPDARYVGYPMIGSDAADCFSRCDLWLIEIDSGRTCLVAKDAPSHQYPQGVGWSPDSRSATYYAKYVPGGFSERHAVNVKTCADQAIEPTPPPPTPTRLPIPGVVIGANAQTLRSPSERYLLVYTSRSAVLPLRPGETPPPNKPFLLTPSPGEAQMYIVDVQTGIITTLVDERREFTPVAWLP